MTQQELQERTLAFALAVFTFVRPLFRDAETRHIAQQLVRCSASVGANYRAACLARSGKEWRARLGVVLEEADEACYWLEFLRQADLRPDSAAERDRLSDEARQLTRIFGAACRTNRNRNRPPTRPSQQSPSDGDGTAGQRDSETAGQRDSGTADPK